MARQCEDELIEEVRALIEESRRLMQDYRTLTAEFERLRDELDQLKAKHRNTDIPAPHENLSIS